MAISAAELDQKQAAYKAAVEEWIAAIQHEEALASVNHDLAEVDKWELAGDAEEELRIAAKRMASGIGLNIDVLNAQRDLTQARINKARAVIDFNVAQSQLLRDTGLVTVDTLVHGAKI